MALRNMLEPWVERNEKANRLADPNVLGRPLLDDPFRECLGLDLEFREEAGAQPAFDRPPPFLVRDLALVHHQLEHQFGAPMRPRLRGLPQGIQACRRLHHAGEHGCLVEREILRLLPEIVAGRPIETHDVASAELDLIEIGRQKGVLAHRSVEGAGMPQLGALPPDTAEHVALVQVVKNEVLQKLHRDGAPPAVEAPLSTESRVMMSMPP